MKIAAVALIGIVGLAGCATHGVSSQAVSPATEAQKQVLLERMKSLEGEWIMKDPESGQMMMASVFKTSSNGSAVREVMFPGSPHEMTNMYHMDGSSLLVTHYCAMGNQPRMRAAAGDGKSIAFTFDSVTNKTSADQSCMGELTIEFADADHIVERWHTLGGGDEHAVFELTRKK